MVAALRISADLALPLDFVTKTCGILAQRRKGKTYTASVIAEELVAAKVPTVVLDPTGAWWGLRASADGQKAGLPVVILGGSHGDVPLERTGGKFVAELVVDEPGFYVIDFSLFESAEAERQFATDFAERLYRRKAQPNSDFALHLIVDEADRFAPQRPPPGDQRMLGAFEAIVRRGGLRGLGTTLITQRAAVINKNVLEQIDMLIVLRVVGPNDQESIERYVKAHGSDEERSALMDSLASLELGEAWVWEPGAEPPLFERIRVRQRRTFNSSATPKAGEKRVEPRRLADVDLDAIKDAMAATIERAKADDPKELRRRIKALEKELQGRAPETVTESVIERVEVPFVPAEVDDSLNRLDELMANLTESLAAAHRATKEAKRGRTDIPRARPAGSGSSAVGGEKSRAAQRSHPPSRRKPSRPPVQRSAPAEGVAPSEAKLLAALAQYPDGRTKGQLALLTGYKGTGGRFNNLCSKLRSNGWAEGTGTLRITDAGLEALGDGWEPLPIGQDLVDYWVAKLPPSESKVFAVVAGAWPDSLTKEELGEATGYEPTGGRFNNICSKLRTFELVEGRGEIRLSADIGEDL